MAKDFKERTITVNLSRAFDKPLTKRAIAAKFALKNCVTKETRLEKVLLSNELNEFLWARGKYNCPRKMAIKIVKEKDTARVMLPTEKYEAKTDKKAPKIEAKKEEVKAAPVEAKPAKEEKAKTAKAKKE